MIAGASLMPVGHPRAPRVPADVYARRVVPFAQARPEIEWAGTKKELTGWSEDVRLKASRRWWGKRWMVASDAPFPIVEPLLLFVSRKGMDHGFWRDFRVGDADFDRRHFVFSDTPALVSIVVGPATRRAIDADVPLEDSLTLYVSGFVARVTGSNDSDDPTAIERHLAIHRALAADQLAFLDAWRELVTSVAGRTESRWPPTAIVMNPVGALQVHLGWTPATLRGVDWGEREDSLRTYVHCNDGRPRSRWSLRAPDPYSASNFEAGGVRFVLRGKPTIARPVLAQLVERGGIASIFAGDDVKVAVRGVATRVGLETAARIVESIMQVEESGTPYR